MELIDKANLDVNYIPCYYGENCRLDDIERWINEQPTITVPDNFNVSQVRVQGKCYVDCEGYERCSVCNKHEDAMRYFTFCPYCGSELV